MGVLRQLEIYDIHVCTLKELAELEYTKPEDKLSTLKTLYENAEVASNMLPVSYYSQMATEFDQNHLNAFGLEKDNVFATGLAEILSSPETEREKGCGYTERQELMDLVSGVMAVYIKEHQFYASEQNRELQK